MQVSDLVGQYNNATARPEMTGTKGIRKLVSTLRDMKSGNIFEGTVNSIKGTKVTLGLPNGQEVTARMDGKVKLEIGQSMFFQVKANDGTQIAIRPYTVEGNNMNLTLMEALKTANLAVDGRNLSMVNAMMEEQMSIDRNSLSQMARVISAHPEVDVKTLVQMQKLEFPITTEMASQFQNYLDDKQAITRAMADFIEALPAAMSGKDVPVAQMTQTAEEILNIITEGLPEKLPEDVRTEGGASNGVQNAALIEVMKTGIEQPEQMTEQATSGQAQAASEQSVTGQVQAAPEQAAQAQAQTAPEQSVPGQVQATPEQAASGQAQAAPEQAAQAQAQSTSEQTQQGQASQPVITEEFLQAVLSDGVGMPAKPHTLGALFGTEQLQTFSNVLEQFPDIVNNPKLFAEGQLLPNASTVSILNAIRQQLGKQPSEELVRLLLSGKEVTALVKDAMEQQWMLKPEAVTDKDKIAKLYEKIDDQLMRLENVVRASGQDSQNVTQLATDIRSNIQFMDQINQAYTYVQIPLQMSGKNASGELYVYTNKKNLAEKSGELTAFLHLDMDHLGSTDVSVKMIGKNVSTNFYFDNDSAYSLVEKHAPILEERLKAKGYNCEIKVANEGKKVNFVEDFLKKDQPSAGLVHRYSFDMRA